MAEVMNIIHGFETICYMHGFETICFIHKMQNHDIHQREDELKALPNR